MPTVLKTMVKRVLVTLVLLSPAIGLVVAHPWSQTAAAQAAARTDQEIVRPVDADGTPATGWQVQDEQVAGDFRCTGPSPVAVGDGIATCGPADAFTIACWKSTDHTVLCLRDPHVQRLARIAYQGSFPGVKAGANPLPLSVDLKFYGSCSVRDGGPSVPLAARPTWVAHYACDSTSHGGGYLYGPTSEPGGLDRSKGRWEVHWAAPERPGGKVRTDHVQTAWFAGDAD